MEGLDRFDFVVGVGESFEAKVVAVEGNRYGAVANRACEDFWGFAGCGGEIGEGLGGDVVDSVALGEPLVPSWRAAIGM